MVFRDDLRVMPYGREDNDFFEIEKDVQKMLVYICSVIGHVLVVYV